MTNLKNAPKYLIEAPLGLILGAGVGYLAAKKFKIAGYGLYAAVGIVAIAGAVIQHKIQDKKPAKPAPLTVTNVGTVTKEKV